MEEAVSKQSNMQLHAFLWLWFVQHIEAKAGFENISFANICQTISETLVVRIRTTFNYPATGRNVP